MLQQGCYKDILRQTGFKDIDVEDLSENVLVMWRLSCVLWAVPFELVRTFGLQNRSTNIMAGVEAYRSWDQSRYLSLFGLPKLERRAAATDSFIDNYP